MTPLPYAALITLLTIAVMFWTALNVGRARATYGVKAPATSGHEMFETLPSAAAASAWPFWRWLVCGRAACGVW
jgi:hypothetical protein